MRSYLREFLTSVCGNREKLRSVLRIVSISFSQWTLFLTRKIFFVPSLSKIETSIANKKHGLILLTMKRSQPGKSNLILTPVEIFLFNWRLAFFYMYYYTSSTINCNLIINTNKRKLRLIEIRVSQYWCNRFAVNRNWWQPRYRKNWT